MTNFFDFAEYHKEILALILATVGGAFALWRWMVDQKWRRVQHAQSLIKDFLKEESTAKAFEILDTLGTVEFQKNSKTLVTIDITDLFLVGALSTFEQKIENTEKELIVRDVLDDFFWGTKHFSKPHRGGAY